jgi:hypothetical protein
MALGATLITFSPGATIRSADMNANFAAINNLATLNVPFLTYSADNGAISSDGNGNILWTGGIGKSGFTDIYSSSSGTTVISESAGAGTIHLQINGTDSITFNATGPTFPAAKKITFPTGSLSRISQFTAGTTGTFSHGLGVIPDVVLPIAWDTVNNPAQFGWDSATSSQVHITIDASQTYIVQCMKF